MALRPARIRTASAEIVRKESVDDNDELNNGVGTNNASTAGCHRPGTAWLAAAQRASGAGSAGRGAGARTGRSDARQQPRQHRELSGTGRCGGLAGRVADVSDRSSRFSGSLQTAVGYG